MRQVSRIVGVLLVLSTFVSIALACDGKSSIPIRLIGRYSNWRFTEEHQYGYKVELWSQGGLRFGTFSASNGLQGDTPIGLLEDVRFDPKSGALEFSARLTMGVVVQNDGKQVPSRDRFRFHGRLSNQRLVGTVLREDALSVGRKSSSSERVVLKRERDQEVSPPPTCGLWLERTLAALKFRGPRW